MNEQSLTGIRNINTFRRLILQVIKSKDRNGKSISWLEQCVGNKLWYHKCKKRKSKQHQHWSKYTNFETEEEGNKIAPQCETSGHWIKNGL